MSVGQLGTTAREWAIGAVGASRLPMTAALRGKGGSSSGMAAALMLPFHRDMLDYANIGAGTIVGQVSCTLHPHGLFAGLRFRPPSAHLPARH
jgi:hypothetical protein